ncbi:MAG: hypothetical protein RR162_00275 [Oscillospiraceae bacterium]
MSKDIPQGADETKAAPTYSIEKLRENCLTLFGVSVSTFDGATCDLTGEKTVEEMKNALTKWGEKEVK